MPPLVAYGADSERTLKSFNGSNRYFFGSDGDLLVDQAPRQGLLTSSLHQDVNREGQVTSFGVKDHLASNRLMTFMANSKPTTRHDYGAYGDPLTTNGSTILNGKGYINERFDTGEEETVIDPLDQSPDERPAISARPLLRPTTRKIPHPRHLGSRHRRG